jgi:hypothetical protein
MPLPAPERLAHHEAGHAVVQHWISEGRYRVTRVSLDSDGGQIAGSSLIDREVKLGLYQFGLVVLAGIAAENRYFSDHPAPLGEQWGALGDIQEWMAEAADLLGEKARVEMVTGNVLRRLAEFFESPSNWSVVCELAQLLLAEGAVEGERLQSILQKQPGTSR